MIKRPDTRVLEALAFLEGTSRFDDVIKWLRESEAETVRALIAERNAEEMWRLQGAASDLKEILELTQKAREALISK